MRAAGGVGVGVTVAVDTTEAGGVAVIRRTLPPVERVAGQILHLAVSRLVVGVLRALSGEGVGGAAEDFNFRQQEQLVVGGLDAAALVARAALFLHLADASLNFRWHQGQDGRQAGGAHGTVLPPAAVGVAAVHRVSSGIAIMKLERQRRFACPIAQVVVVLADDVNPVVRPVDEHILVASPVRHPSIRHLIGMARFDDVRPFIL